MEKINSHILKLTGKAELPEPIEIGHNYHLALEGSITAVTETDNDDGTRNRVYSFRPIKLDLLNDKGETLKLKDTRSYSQLFRARMWKQWQNAPDDLTFDDWYARLMENLIQFAPEVAEMYRK